MKNKKTVQIGAYYFPGYGKEHNEWEIVKSAKKYIKQQNQPKIPLNGYYNDNNPKTIKRQIKIASEHGIDSFIFDWYWKKGKIYLNKPLDLFIKENSSMKFALMFSWKLAKSYLPVEKGKQHESEEKRWIMTNKKDFIKMLEFCQKKYFSNKNYWKINNQPYFIMYYVGGFLNKLGEKKLKNMIEYARRYFAKKAMPIPFFVGVVTNTKKTDFGFDALTGYNFLPDFKKNAKLIQDYKSLYKKRIKDWNKISKNSKIPYIPSISAGWDATPRGIRIKKLSSKLGFPWSPVVINNNPKNFGSFLKEVKKFCKENSIDIIHICAWNEWSEGACIEPDEKYKDGYLKQILRISRK